MLYHYLDEGESPLEEFKAQHQGGHGSIRGSLPVCIKCAPPCKKCNLPKVTEPFLEFVHMRKLNQDHGVCNCIDFKLLIIAIFKRIFGLGRFRRP